MLSNFHCHSQFCDGTNPIEDYITEAISQGFSSIGISSHCPVKINNLWSMKEENLPAYLHEIEILKEKYKSQIQVYASLEIDFIPEICDVSIFKDQLDYTIGSVHYAGCFADGSYFEVDGSTQLFKKGIDEIYHGDIELFLETYFSLIQEMILKSPPQVIGHIDKIKIHNVVENFWNENGNHYKELLFETLELIAQKKILVEVNTRGIYKKKTTETYPSIQTLKLMKDLNIGVVVNSDSHHPREISLGFDIAYQNLKAAGYNSSFHFLEGEWKEVEFL